MKVKKLHRAAITPSYATSGAACFDLHALDAGSIAAHQAETIGTGLAFEVPEGHVMLVFSRSGHSFKRNLRLANCVGVIDSDYRGEVLVRMQNDGDTRQTVLRDERIAQALILPVQQVTFEEVDELSDTARGAGGFGSTGVQ